MLKLKSLINKHDKLSLKELIRGRSLQAEKIEFPIFGWIRIYFRVSKSKFYPDKQKSKFYLDKQKSLIRLRGAGDTFMVCRSHCVSSNSKCVMLFSLCILKLEMCNVEMSIPIPTWLSSHGLFGMLPWMDQGSNSQKKKGTLCKKM